MSPSSSSEGKWLAANGASVPSDPSSFKIVGAPHTDIWRRSDADDVFSAPMVYQKLRASAFKRLAVTIFAPWKTQYDQGGLVVAFPSPREEEGTGAGGEQEKEEGEGGGPGPASKWIKAGIEFFELRAVLGVVGTDRYSDWSLAPMDQARHQKATVSAVRDGSTLWIYAAQEGAEKLLPLREIKWAFMEDREEAEVWVGVYAAKPTPEEGDENEVLKGIEVTFTDLTLERDE